MKGFLLASLSVVVGTFLGAIAGGVLGSVGGPGGSIVGAIWGAFKGGNIAVLTGTGVGVAFGSTLGILQMLPPTNMVQEYATKAQKAVKNSLEYRVKQTEDVKPVVSSPQTVVSGSTEKNPTTTITESIENTGSPLSYSS